MKYSTAYEPPAPVLEVQVSNPHRGQSVRCSAKLDTGADISAIPERLVEELALVPLGEMPIMGWDGSPSMSYFYLVAIGLEEQGFEDRCLVISASRDEMLLGRDILNQLTVILEGKTLSFQVSAD